MTDGYIMDAFEWTEADTISYDLDSLVELLDKYHERFCLRATTEGNYSVAVRNIRNLVDGTRRRHIEENRRNA